MVPHDEYLTRISVLAPSACDAIAMSRLDIRRVTSTMTNCTTFLLF